MCVFSRISCEARFRHFDLNSSHVLPALVKKFITAKIKNYPSVEVWGSGNVKREFLNVEDLSSAIYFVIKKKIKYDFINVGGGDHFSIKKIPLACPICLRGNIGEIFFLNLRWFTFFTNQAF